MRDDIEDRFAARDDLTGFEPGCAAIEASIGDGAFRLHADRASHPQGAWQMEALRDDDDPRCASWSAKNEACGATLRAARASAHHDAGRNVFASASSCHIQSFIADGDAETMPSITYKRSRPGSMKRML